eukprot:Gb_20482 [translate_table: standard]
MQKSSSPYAKETVTALLPVGTEQEVIDADLLLPSVLPFKRIQMSEKYPKGHARGRHWKHLKQILQAENYHSYPADEPNSLWNIPVYCMAVLAPFLDDFGIPWPFPSLALEEAYGETSPAGGRLTAFSLADVNIESPPSMYPAKKYCDISGFEAPYTDPRTKLRFANVEVFKRIRSLPDEYIQGYLSLRNAAVILK